jgi:hypothetical protein
VHGLCVSLRDSFRTICFIVPADMLEEEFYYGNNLEALLLKGLFVGFIFEILRAFQQLLKPHKKIYTLFNNKVDETYRSFGLARDPLNRPSLHVPQHDLISLSRVAEYNEPVVGTIK